MSLFITLPGAKGDKVQMFVPHGEVRAMVPIKLEFTQSSLRLLGALGGCSTIPEVI